MLVRAGGVVLVALLGLFLIQGAAHPPEGEAPGAPAAVSAEGPPPAPTPPVPDRPDVDPLKADPLAVDPAAPRPAGSEVVATREALREATPPTPPEASPAPPARDEPRNRRRRRADRWPGPVPTPAEWRPPEGPVRVALQAGHWRADEAPGELNGLREGGTRWRALPEWRVNLAIAEAAAALLEEEGYLVDILPAVVPPSYRAHLFISIHADGSNDPRATGYRVAPPRRDATGRAAGFATLLERHYGEATGIARLPTVTRRMQNYYAFNFQRYEHALHPMTIGVILETGFLTSARDREIIVDEPATAARGIVDAVLAFEVTRLPAASASPAPLGLPARP